MQKVKSELCSTSVCDYFGCPTFLKIFQSFQEAVCQLVRRDHCPYRPSISGRCRRHPRKSCYFIANLRNYNYNGHIQGKRQKRLPKLREGHFQDGIYTFYVFTVQGPECLLFSDIQKSSFYKYRGSDVGVINWTQGLTRITLTQWATNVKHTNDNLVYHFACKCISLMCSLVIEGVTLV